MDAGEDASAAAVRELREETGYSGSVATVSPVCYSDPGMTDANMQVDHLSKLNFLISHIVFIKTQARKNLEALNFKQKSIPFGWCSLCAPCDPLLPVSLLTSRPLPS